jgi:hypothetical protein
LLSLLSISLAGNFVHIKDLGRKKTEKEFSDDEGLFRQLNKIFCGTELTDV